MPWTQPWAWPRGSCRGNRPLQSRADEPTESDLSFGTFYSQNFTPHASLDRADESDPDDQRCGRNQECAQVEHAPQRTRVSNSKEAPGHQQRGGNRPNANRPNQRRWDRRVIYSDLQEQREQRKDSRMGMARSIKGDLRGRQILRSRCSQPSIRNHIENRQSAIYDSRNENQADSTHQTRIWRHEFLPKKNANILPRGVLTERSRGRGGLFPGALRSFCLHR